MDKNTLKKTGAIATGVLLALTVAIFVILYVIISVPWPVIAAELLIGVGLCALIIYEVHIRIKELDEGLEDAVDNY